MKPNARFNRASHRGHNHRLAKLTAERMLREVHSEEITPTLPVEPKKKIRETAQQKRRREWEEYEAWASKHYGRTARTWMGGTSGYSEQECGADHYSNEVSHHWPEVKE